MKESTAFIEGKKAAYQEMMRWANERRNSPRQYTNVADTWGEVVTHASRGAASLEEEEADTHL